MYEKMKVAYPRFSFACAAFAVFIFLFPFGGYAQEFDYGRYQGLLNRYVYEDRVVKGITLNVVDYEGLYEQYHNPSSDLAQILEQLKGFNPDTLPMRASRIAFWINAYNIGAIKMILDYYPVDSIRSMKINFFKNPWNKEILNINGTLYSLGEIEHEILLGKYRELTAHFAIVCASLSCPEITKEVFIGQRLQSQLESQARKFLNYPKKGYSIDRSRNTVSVSRIFQFDSKNFSRGKEDIIPFILPFIKDKQDREYLKTQEYDLAFLEYDWDLNTLQSVK